MITDDWVPLRCSWGSSSDGSGNDSGATTGPGDWGSAGNFDASSFNADAFGGNVNAFTGTAFDASIFGTGMGSAGDWGSFAPTSYAGFNVSDPNQTQNISLSPFDVGMSQVGSGDWGSSGVYSAAGLNVDPSASNVSTGAGLYNTGDFFSSTGAYSGYSPYASQQGGLFGSYQGGNVYGDQGPSSSGSRSGSLFTQDDSGSRSYSSGHSLGGSTAASAGRSSSSSSSGRTGAPTRSEAQIASVVAPPDDTPAAPEGEPLASTLDAERSQDQPAAPAAPDAEPEAPSAPVAAPEAEPSAPTSSPSTSAFGPAHAGSSPSTHPDETSGPASGWSTSTPTNQAIVNAANEAAQNTDYQSAASIVANDLYGNPAYQPSQQPDFFGYGPPPADQQPVFTPDFRAGPGYYDIAPNPVDLSVTPQGEKGVNQLYDTLVTNNPLNPYNPNFLQFEFPTNQPTTNFNIWSTLQSHPLNPWNPNNVYPSLPYYPGYEGYPTATDPPAPVNVENNGPPSLATQLGIDQIGANLAPAQTPAEFMPGGAQTSFEGYQPAGAQQVDEGGFLPPADTFATTPAEFMPGGAMTSFEGQPVSGAFLSHEGEPISSTGHTNFFEPGGFFGPGQTTGGQFFDPLGVDPSAPMTSPDGALTAGGDPALSGAAAGDAAAQSGAPSQAGDAAAQAAAAAAARGGDPVDQANAAAAAAMQAGATQQQADAIASAVYDAAAGRASTQEGGGPPQAPGITLAQVLDAVYGTGGPYVTPGGNIYGAPSTTLADIRSAVYGADYQPGTSTGPAVSGRPPSTEQPSANPPSTTTTQPGSQVYGPSRPGGVVDVRGPQSLIEMITPGGQQRADLPPPTVTLPTREPPVGSTGTTVPGRERATVNDPNSFPPPVAPADRPPGYYPSTSPGVPMWQPGQQMAGGTGTFGEPPAAEAARPPVTEPPPPTPGAPPFAPFGPFRARPRPGQEEPEPGQEARERAGRTEGFSTAPIMPPGQSHTNRPAMTPVERAEFPNSRADTPSNPNYQDRGLRWSQGIPGVAYRTAEQAGVRPLFPTGPHNWQDMSASMVRALNQAWLDMNDRQRASWRMNSGYRPDTRAEARALGMSDFQSQESVFARGHPAGPDGRGMRGFPSAPPGRSFHGGRAIDLGAGAARDFLRANAARYGLTDLLTTRGIDAPHFQLTGRPEQPSQQESQRAQQNIQNRTQAAQPPRPPADIPAQATPLPPQRPAEAPPAQPEQRGELGPQQELGPQYAQQQQAPSLLDMLGSLLSQFNPISTAEARGGRTQADPRIQPGGGRQADPGTIQSRLSEQRTGVLADVRNDPNLFNLLNAIAGGEVGSQGRAAVLGWLETALNKVAAEAAVEGRSATGRDLANYLLSTQYFPETWGKIESGRTFGDVVDNDLLSALAQGANSTGGATGNASGKVGFGGNPVTATIGKEKYGVENYASHNLWAQNLYSPARGASSFDTAGFIPTGEAVAARPAAEPPPGLAEGGKAKKGKPYVVGEQGPELFVPDETGTVVPSGAQFYLPQRGKNNFPQLPSQDYPGRWESLGRRARVDTEVGQDAMYGPGGLLDLMQSRAAGKRLGAPPVLRINPAAWDSFILNQLPYTHIEDRRQYDPTMQPPGSWPY